MVVVPVIQPSQSSSSGRQAQSVVDPSCFVVVIAVLHGGLGWDRGALSLQSLSSAVVGVPHRCSRTCWVRFWPGFGAIIFISLRSREASQGVVAVPAGTTAWFRAVIHQFSHEASQVWSPYPLVQLAGFVRHLHQSEVTGGFTGSPYLLRQLFWCSHLHRLKLLVVVEKW